MEGLEKIASSGDDVSGLNKLVTDMLGGLTDEQAERVMKEIDAIDKMDIDAWRNL
jgi:hypothetical protein